MGQEQMVDIKDDNPVVKIPDGDANYSIEILPSTSSVANAYSAFVNQVELIENKQYSSKITYYNTEVFDLISRLPINKLIIALTSSNSIFYRFSTSDNKYEFKLELFLDYDYEDETDVQSTLHIYYNGEKKGSYFGSIEDLFKTITEAYANTEFNNKVVEVFDPVENVDNEISCEINP